MKRYLAALLIVGYFDLSTRAMAGECPKPVTLLNQGEVAPCTGFLFSREKEKELRLLDEDYKLLQERSSITDKQIQLYKQNEDVLNSVIDKERQKSKLWEDQAEKYTQKYIEEQNNRSNRDWLFFAGGVLLTLGAAWAVGAAAGGHK